MKPSSALAGVIFMLLSFSSFSFEIDRLSDLFFKDTAVGIERQLKDARFEFEADSAILASQVLTNKVHILVARNKNSVLIAGQAISPELRDKVQKMVLGVAHVKWKQGDVNHVEPANAQICGKGASRVSGNERRKFNLKSAGECSTVNRVYNEVIISAPMNETQQSDDDLLRARIVNKLLHAKVIEKADTIKVVVTGGLVYLLGDQLTEEFAGEVSQFVTSLPEVKKVVPLFRF